MGGFTKLWKAVAEGAGAGVGKAPQGMWGVMEVAELLGTCAQGEGDSGVGCRGVSYECVFFARVFGGGWGVGCGGCCKWWRLGE